MPTPNDDTSDYSPVLPSQVVIGETVLVLLDVAGTVLDATPPLFDASPFDCWLWNLETTLPDGSTGTAPSILYITPDPATPWFLTTMIYKRISKPAVSTLFTSPDGSEWIYPDDGTGGYECYLSGSLHDAGETGTRGVVDGVTAPNLPISDVTWDWVPVDDGADVDVGDYILFAFGKVREVGDITTFDADGVVTYELWNTTGDVFVEMADTGSGFASAVGARQWLYLVTDKPAADTLFLAADGSRWIFPDNTDGTYFCWKAGTTYQPGALYLLGDITGGLTTL